MRAHANRSALWLVAGLLAGPAVTQAGAQQAEPRVLILESSHPSVPDAVMRTSAFQLTGLADIAFGGIRNRGVHVNRVNNDGTINYAQGNPSGIFIRNTPRGNVTPYFLADFYLGAAKGDWERARQLAPSLNNALGDGYTVNYNENTGFFARIRQWRPGDDQFGRVHSGVSSTSDGACTQHTSFAAGNPLMAINDCPPTWGSEQFAGAQRKTTFGQWVELFNALGPTEFTWDWWRVPSEFVSADLMGDAQSYYTFVDWANDRLARFGNVVPGGSGEPTETGWPLGISVKTDVFSFSLPSVADAAIYQMAIINDSEKVYGVPLDYDSLYVGNGHGVLFQNQEAGHYWRPELGGVLFTNYGFNPNCNGAIPVPGLANCRYPNGLNNGGSAIIFLKSPIGDLRNKLFSDPESEFFAPEHPSAGDTLTFNHGRRCSFGGCWGPVITRSERAEFGMIASQPTLVLDGRSVTAMDAQAAWFDVFSNVDFPTRTPEFTTYVPPGGWDYDHDGVPDTIHVNSCHTNGCVELFSDTLPGGHGNGDGNLSGVTMAGPFGLAAGDTAGITIAFVSGSTPEGMLQNVRNIIDFYLNGFLGPTPPPPPNVVSVNVTPGDRGQGTALTPQAQVQIFLDDAPEQFEDPFLQLIFEQLQGSQVAEDNPGLLDSLQARISTNVEEILVFKSCDGGTSFTADADCDGDPLVDAQGTAVESGWRPYRVLEADDDGNFPNIFVDQAVTPGLTYVYSFVAVSKGFSPLVLARNDAGELIPAQFEGGAPALRNPLSASTSDPNVVSVYVPASRQLGGAAAQVVFLEEDEFFTSSFNPIGVQITGDVSTGGTFRVVFGDSVVVTEVRSDAGVTSTVEVYRTVVTSTDGDTLQRVVVDQSTFTSTSAEGVDVAGGETTRTTEGDADVVTTVFDGLTLILLDAGNRPIFVSSRLSGESTTPGAVLARQDFPLFLLDVDVSDAGDFVSDTWQVIRGGVPADLRGGGSPTVQWVEGSSTPTSLLLGEYSLDWAGPAFGPREVFIPNLADPEATEAELAASLEARAVAQRTSISPEVAAALGVEPSELLDVPLPFTVTNATTGQPVTVAMRAGAKRATIPLGRLTEEIQVEVPEDIWVPGEPLVFLERRLLPRTATTADGDEFVVLENGQPVLVDSLVVTFDPAVIGCAAPVTCNPVPASAQGANVGGFLPIDPGMRLRVRYISTLRPGSSFSFEIRPALRGDQIETVTGADLDRIKVVPNPYVVFSQYEQERDSEVSRLMFTGLPPEGAITIFTISGQVVQRISYAEADLAGNGDLFWDMRTLENTDLGAGLYLFLVEGTLPASGRDVRKLGKFVVIR